MKEIVIRVTRNGKVILDYNGFKGSECIKDRDELLDQIYAKYGVRISVLEEHLKNEYYSENVGGEKVEYM